MKSIICNRCGKIYNSERYTECPYCGAGEEDIPVLSKEQEGMDIYICKNGHRIEGLNVSYCPYCGSTRIRKETEQQKGEAPVKVPRNIKKLPIILSAAGVLAVIIAIILIVALSGGKKEKKAEKEAEKKTEKEVENTYYEKPAIYEINDGFFVINTDLFGKSYQEIAELLKAQGYSDTFEQYEWFSDSDEIIAAWINPSTDASVGFFFCRDKLAAMEFNDKKAGYVPYRFEEKIEKYTWGDDMKSFELATEKTGNTDFAKNKLGYLFVTDKNTNGSYTIRRHSYVDDKGKNQVTVSQIYNTLDYYLYESEYEVWQ